MSPNFRGLPGREPCLLFSSCSEKGEVVTSGSPSPQEDALKKSLKLSIALLFIVTNLTGCIIWPGWWDEGGGRGGHGGHGHHEGGYDRGERR